MNDTCPDCGQYECACLVAGIFDDILRDAEMDAETKARRQ